MNRTFIVLSVLLGYAIAGLWAKVQGPYWIVREQSPGYTYLLNSLHWLSTWDLRAVMYHPGILLTAMGAAIVKLFSRAGNPTLQVLANPELYLAIWQKLLAASFVGALGLAGFRFYRRFGAGVGLWVFLISPFLFPSLVQCLGRISCEPLLASLALVGIAVVLDGRHTAIPLAILAAVGLSTKLTFLPVCVFFFLTFEDRRSRVLFTGILVTLYGALMSTLGHDAVECARFLVQAVTGTDSALPAEIHEGRSRVVPYFTKVLRSNPFLLALPFLIGTDRHSRAALAGIGVGIVLLALKPSEIYYVVPILVLVGFVVSLKLRAGISWKTDRFYLAPAAMALLTVGVFASDYHQFRTDTRSRTSLQQQAHRASMEGPVVYCNFSSSPVFALLKANYTVREFTTELSHLYPKSLFCDPLTGQLATWDRKLTADEVLKELITGKLHVLAPSGVESRLAEVFPDKRVEAATLGEIESLYRVW